MQERNVKAHLEQCQQLEVPDVAVTVIPDPEQVRRCLVYICSTCCIAKEEYYSFQGRLVPV